MKTSASGFGVVFCLIFTVALAQEGRPLQPDAPKPCEPCDGWNEKHEPFKVFGNTYYVGVAGLSSVLIASEKGHILLDGGLPQSAPLIEQNLRSLGFRLEDVRLIAVSHTHYDHVGGVAALQRASGAVVAASAAGARALEAGEPTPDDPQYGFGRASNEFPPVRGVRVVADGEAVSVGGVSVTAHLTPGHTPGSTTWTWRSCEGSQCLTVVYADSLNAVAAPDFRFSASPERVALFRRSIATVRELPCDILLTVHPGFSRLSEKLRLRREGAAAPFVDPLACRAYADAAAGSLQERLETER